MPAWGWTSLGILLLEAKEDFTALVAFSGLFGLLLLRLLAPDEKRRFQLLAVATSVHLSLVPVCAALRSQNSDAYTDVRLLCLTSGVVCIAGQLGVMLFVWILPRFKIAAPHILQDAVVATFAAIGVFYVASRIGINLSGIVATSAVLTAVIGLALQDTIGNVFAGLALQVDTSITAGEWIKVGDLSGKIKEIRWRYTAIETRNWETLVIPNSRLTKEQVLVLGKRTGERRLWRRWVWFNVDYRFSPADVVETVAKALNGGPIENVSDTPKPDCVFMSFDESYGRFAARYWLTDIARDDPTDSVVRMRIYYALQRASIPLSIPAHALFVTAETTERTQAKRERQDARRLEILRRVDLMANLPEEDLQTLARSLVPAPFAAGEIITRQGAVAHWFYLILEGRASVRVANEHGESKEVSELRDGSFFGEMSLMTGAPRSATVVAVTDVECYRLEKEAFKIVLQRRPELAEEIAEILAKRQVELSEAKSSLANSKAGLDATKLDLLDRIRVFFGLPNAD